MTTDVFPRLRADGESHRRIWEFSFAMSENVFACVLQALNATPFFFCPKSWIFS
jgi:hypothetical protein